MTNHPEGRFMTLNGGAVDFDGIECCFLITGSWITLPRIEIAGMVRLSTFRGDSYVIEGSDMEIDGPVKIEEIGPRYPTTPKTTYVFANTKIRQVLLGLANNLDAGGGSVAHDAFEKLKLEKRPRINLALASKVPGDVNVCCEVERKNWC